MPSFPCELPFRICSPPGVFLSASLICGKENLDKALECVGLGTIPLAAEQYANLSELLEKKNVVDFSIKHPSVQLLGFAIEDGNQKILSKTPTTYRAEVEKFKQIDMEIPLNRSNETVGIRLITAPIIGGGAS